MTEYRKFKEVIVELSHLKVQAGHHDVPIRRNNWYILTHNAIVHVYHFT